MSILLIIDYLDKELSSLRIEIVDHFTFLSTQKEALLNQLYTKLQSSEFNALKEVATIMAKSQDEFLKNQKNFHVKYLLNQRELLNNQEKSIKNQEEHQKQILEAKSFNHNTTFKKQIINMFCGHQPPQQGNLLKGIDNKTVRRQGSKRL